MTRLAGEYRDDGSMVYSHLEDVEAFILHHPPIVLQLPHDELQVLARIHVFRHDLVELSVQQDLSQQLDALPLGNITLRSYQNIIVLLEEELKVGGNELGLSLIHI